jgi:hypothetical protein
MRCQLWVIRVEDDRMIQRLMSGLPKKMG